MVDSNGKMNKRVAMTIKRWITGKRPGLQVVHKHSAKIQQTDDHNCGPILLFNIENITQSKRPDAFDVHIPTKAAILNMRQKCHNLAYLQLKGVDTPKHTRNGATLAIVETDVKSTEDKGWLTDNVINLVSNDFLCDNANVICDTNFYNANVKKEEYNRVARNFFKDNNTPNLIIPILVDNSHWILAAVSRRNVTEEQLDNSHTNTC